MEYKKARWEQKYEKFKQDRANIPIIETKINELRREMAALKEGPEYAQKKKEFAELSKTLTGLKGIERNVNNIELLLEYKRRIEAETLEYIEKRNALIQEEPSKKVSAMQTRIKKHNDRIIFLQEELNKVEKTMANPELSEDERKEIMDKRNIILTSIGQNTVWRMDAIKEKKRYEELAKTYDGKEIKTMDRKILANEQLLAKYDLIGASLLKGKNWEQIEPKLSNFEFKHDKNFEKKMQEMKQLREEEKAKEDNSEKEKPKTDATNIDRQKTEETPREQPREISSYTEEPEGELPVELTKWQQFLQKHPKIQKFLDKVKGFFKKDKSSEYIYKIKPITPEEVEEFQKKIEEKKKEQTRSSFRESLKVETIQKREEIRQRAEDRNSERYAIDTELKEAFEEDRSKKQESTSER